VCEAIVLYARIGQLDPGNEAGLMMRSTKKMRYKYLDKNDRLGVEIVHIWVNVRFKVPPE